jgi:putative phage-type endonuclease
VIAQPLPRQQIGSNGIGGSEIAAALGLNPYKSPLELWLEKTGRRPGFQGNARTEWGLDVEPALRSWYVRAHDLAVLVPAASLYHPEHTWLRATPDGIALREDPGEAPMWDHGFEAKNVGRRSAHRWGEPGTDEVPIEYLLQAQQGMAVASLHRWVIVASIAGDPPAEYIVHRDREIIEMIVDGGSAFMALVADDVEPEIDASEAWSDHLAERYPHARDTYATATATDDELAAELRSVRDQIDSFADVEAEIVHRLKASIGSWSGLDTAVGRFTWKPQRARQIVDWSAIAHHLAAAAGLDLAPLVELHTSSAKPARPFNVPRTWRK